jgi:hypothetical protein
VKSRSHSVAAVLIQAVPLAMAVAGRNGLLCYRVWIVPTRVSSAATYTCSGCGTSPVAVDAPVDSSITSATHCLDLEDGDGLGAGIGWARDVILLYAGQPPLHGPADAGR